MGFFEIRPLRPADSCLGYLELDDGVRVIGYTEVLLGIAGAIAGFVLRHNHATAWYWILMLGILHIVYAVTAFRAARSHRTVLEIRVFWIATLLMISVQTLFWIALIAPLRSHGTSNRAAAFALFFMYFPVYAGFLLIGYYAWSFKARELTTDGAYDQLFN